MVARRLDSTRRNTAFIGIGRRHRPRHLKVDKHPNALTQALHYRELLESGQADSQGELSRHPPHHDFGLPASPRVGRGGPCRGPEPVGRGREGRQVHRTPAQAPRGPAAGLLSLFKEDLACKEDLASVERSLSAPEKKYDDAVEAMIGRSLTTACHRRKEELTEWIASLEATD